MARPRWLPRLPHHPRAVGNNRCVRRVGGAVRGPPAVSRGDAATAGDPASALLLPTPSSPPRRRHRVAPQTAGDPGLAAPGQARLGQGARAVRVAGTATGSRRGAHTAARGQASRSDGQLHVGWGGGDREPLFHVRSWALRVGAAAAASPGRPPAERAATPFTAVTGRMEGYKGERETSSLAFAFSAPQPTPAPLPTRHQPPASSLPAQTRSPLGATPSSLPTPTGCARVLGAEPSPPRGARGCQGVDSPSRGSGRRPRRGGRCCGDRDGGARVGVARGRPGVRRPAAPSAGRPPSQRPPPCHGATRAGFARPALRA